MDLTSKSKVTPLIKTKVKNENQDNTSILTTEVTMLLNRLGLAPPRELVRLSNNLSAAAVNKEDSCRAHLPKDIHISP